VAERPAGGGRNRGGVGRWKKEQRGKEALTRGPELAARGKGGSGRSGWGKRNGPAWPTRGRRRGKGAREGEGVGLLGSISFTSSFLFLFYTLSIQTNPIEFKIQFEFKPINSTQIKQCCGMNAQTL
jgi:hypothetical protein